MSLVAYHMPIGRFAARIGVPPNVLWVATPSITCTVTASRAWQPYLPCEPAFVPSRFVVQSFPTMAVGFVPCYVLPLLLDAFWGYTVRPLGVPAAAINGILPAGPPCYFMWPGDHMIVLNYSRLIKFVYQLSTNRHEAMITVAGSVTDVPNSLPAINSTYYALEVVPQSTPSWNSVFNQTQRGAFTPNHLRFFVNGSPVSVISLRLEFDLGATPSYAGGINPIAPTPMPSFAAKAAEEEPAWFWSGKPELIISFVSPDVETIEQNIAPHHVVENVSLWIPYNIIGNNVQWFIITLPYAQVEMGYSRYLSRSVTQYVVYLRMIGEPFRLGTANGTI